MGPTKIFSRPYLYWVFAGQFSGAYRGLPGPSKSHSQDYRQMSLNGSGELVIEACPRKCGSRRVVDLPGRRWTTFADVAERFNPEPIA
jgi:hypothetical protein